MSAERPTFTPDAKVAETKESKFVRQLGEVMERLDPDEFSPFWIQKNYPSLCKRMTAAIREGAIADWETVVDQLDKKWKERWTHRGKSADYRPAQPYDSQEEVEQALESHIERLYTFVTASSREEKKMRDQIIDLLIALIQKGNGAAKKKMEELIEPIVQDRLESNESLAPYKVDRDTLQAILDRCLYLYRPGTTPFLGYFISSLQLRARGLQERKGDSLDEPIYDGGKRTRGEVVADTTVAEAKVSDEERREELISAFKREMSKRLDTLLASGAALKDIAALLGAESFLHSEQRRNQAPALRFDVRAFVEDQIAKGVFLRLPDGFQHLKQTVLPPDAREMAVGLGTGTMEKKKIIPRSHYLVEVLSVLGQPYRLVDGTNSPNMMRTQSYKVFLVDGIKKVIFVNDEEGNATFIVHDVDTKKSEWERLLAKTKNELRELGDGKITVIVYPGDAEEWKIRVHAALTSDMGNNGRRASSNETHDYSQSTERAGSEWLTTGALMRKLEEQGIHRSYPIIRREAENYRASHPEWFRYSNKLEFYHPELVHKLEDIFRVQQLEMAPAGWLTASRYHIDRLGGRQSGWQTVKKEAERYRAEHPEWFKDFRSLHRGELHEHYHPDLVKSLDGFFEQRGAEKPPVDWLPVSRILTNIKKEGFTGSAVGINRIADEYRSDNPHWFKRYRFKDGTYPVHYHPDLVNVIEKRVRQRELEKAPDGWVTPNWLIVKFRNEGIDVIHALITAEADVYRTSHPEWFQMYRGGNNFEWSVHYHPDLAKIIDEKIKRRHAEKAPPDWFTLPTIAEQFKASGSSAKIKAIESEIQRNRLPHPEWFSSFRSARGQFDEHYHRDLLEVLKKVFQQREANKAEERWMTVGSLLEEFRKQDVKTSYRSIRAIAERYRSEHPDWIMKKYGARSQYDEHYSPILVEIIRQEVRST